ncbi:MAG: hypothetical protein ACW98F_17745 [Candidatus Hodarchaeales archaeon]|jgi:hypothetical protein
MIFKPKEVILTLLVILSVFTNIGFFPVHEINATDYCFVVVRLDYFYCGDPVDPNSVGEFYGYFKIGTLSYNFWDIDVARYTYGYGNRKTVKAYESGEWMESYSSQYDTDSVSVAQGTTITFYVYEYDPWPGANDFVLSGSTTVPSTIGLRTSTYSSLTFYGSGGNRLKVQITYFRTA